MTSSVRSWSKVRCLCGRSLAVSVVCVADPKPFLLCRLFVLMIYQVIQPPPVGPITQDSLWTCRPSFGDDRDVKW